MIKAYLVLKGGMVPIQIRSRQMKYLYAAMHNEFRWKTRFQRWLKRLFSHKPKIQKKRSKPK